MMGAQRNDAQEDIIKGRKKEKKKDINRSRDSREKSVRWLERRVKKMKKT